MTERRFLLLCSVTGIKDIHVTYPSCDRCYSKLLLDYDTNRWHCIRCRHDYREGDLSWRYRLSVYITDDVSSCNVCLFGSTLEQYFGDKATQFARNVDYQERHYGNSEDLLRCALHQVFVGKSFYFGFKMVSSHRLDGVTLGDVIKYYGGSSIPFTQLTQEDAYSNSNIISYQMLPSTDSMIVTISHVIYSLIKGQNKVECQDSSSLTAISRSNSSFDITSSYKNSEKSLSFGQPTLCLSCDNSYRSLYQSSITAASTDKNSQAGGKSFSGNQSGPTAASTDKLCGLKQREDNSLTSVFLSVGTDDMRKFSDEGISQGVRDHCVLNEDSSPTFPASLPDNKAVLSHISENDLNISLQNSENLCKVFLRNSMTDHKYDSAISNGNGKILSGQEKCPPLQPHHFLPDSEDIEAYLNDTGFESEFKSSQESSQDFLVEKIEGKKLESPNYLCDIRSGYPTKCRKLSADNSFLCTTSAVKEEDNYSEVSQISVKTVYNRVKGDTKEKVTSETRGPFIEQIYNSVNADKKGKGTIDDHSLFINGVMNYDVDKENKDPLSNCKLSKEKTFGDIVTVKSVVQCVAVNTTDGGIDSGLVSKTLTSSTGRDIDGTTPTACLTLSKGKNTDGKGITRSHWKRVMCRDTTENVDLGTKLENSISDPAEAELRDSFSSLNENFDHEESKKKDLQVLNQFDVPDSQLEAEVTHLITSPAGSSAERDSSVLDCSADLFDMTDNSQNETHNSSHKMSTPLPETFYEEHTEAVTDKPVKVKCVQFARRLSHVKTTHLIDLQMKLNTLPTIPSDQLICKKSCLKDVIQESEELFNQSDNCVNLSQFSEILSQDLFTPSPQCPIKSQISAIATSTVFKDLQESVRSTDVRMSTPVDWSNCNSQSLLFSEPHSVCSDTKKCKLLYSLQNSIHDSNCSELSPSMFSQSENYTSRSNNSSRKMANSGDLFIESQDLFSAESSLNYSIGNSDLPVKKLFTD